MLLTGFKITEVTHEKEDNGIKGSKTSPELASTTVKKQPFLSFARQQLQRQQPIINTVVIRLEKKVTKLSNIMYQISFKKNDPISHINPPVLLRNKSVGSLLLSQSSTKPPNSLERGLSSNPQDILKATKTRVKQSWANAVAGEGKGGMCHPLCLLTHVYECVFSKLYNSMKHFVYHFIHNFMS
jgi:hypothetical protein